MTISSTIQSIPVQSTFRVRPMEPFRCKCGITLGYTNGKRLVVGGISFWRTSKFCCNVCRQDVTWIKSKGE